MGLHLGLAYDAGLAAEDRFYVVVPGSQATLALKGTAAIDRDLTLGLATFTVTGGTALVAGTTGGVIDQSKDARLTLDLADPGATPDGKITARELAGDPGGVFANLAVDGAVQAVLPLVRLPGMEPTTNPEIILSWTDLGDVNSLVRPPQTQDLADYVNQATSFDPAAANGGIEAIQSLIGGWANVGLLNTKIPLVNKSIGGVFNYVDEARKFFTAVVDAHPATSGQFDAAVLGARAAAGLDPAEVSVTTNSAFHDPAAGRFRYVVDYHYVKALTDVPFDFGFAPAFTFAGKLNPTVRFNAQLEFGLNREDGFFLVDRGAGSPEATVQIAGCTSRQLERLGGLFGLVEYAVHNATADLNDVTLSIDLVDPNASGGRITASEMSGSFSAVVRPSATAGTADLDFPMGVLLGAGGVGGTPVSGPTGTRLSPAGCCTARRATARPTRRTGSRPCVLKWAISCGRPINPFLGKINDYNPLDTKIADVASLARSAAEQDAVGTGGHARTGPVPDRYPGDRRQPAVGHASRRLLGPDAVFRRHTAAGQHGGVAHGRHRHRGCERAVGRLWPSIRSLSRSSTATGIPTTTTPAPSSSCCWAATWI